MASTNPEAVKRLAAEVGEVLLEKAALAGFSPTDICEAAIYIGLLIPLHLAKPGQEEEVGRATVAAMTGAMPEILAATIKSNGPPQSGG